MGQVESTTSEATPIVDQETDQAVTSISLAALQEEVERKVSSQTFSLSTDLQCK